MRVYVGGATLVGPGIADRETGIGTWSLEAFARAMHEGVRKDGAHLYPAFPYDRFTRTSDEDVAALYAYLMSIPAVHHVPPKNELIASPIGLSKCMVT